MIHCQACGYPNDSSEHRCENCGVRFMALQGAVAVAEQPAGEAREQPEARMVPLWRGEVSERVARFRVRRGLQAALPLEYPEPAGKVIAFPAPRKKPSARTPSQARQRASAAIPQPLLEFPEPLPAAAPPQPSVDFPVAPLMARAVSAFADAAMVATGYGLLFGAYHLAGGRLPWNRWTLLAALAGLALLPLFYLFLFLVFSAGTPGMRWTRLRLVDFNGRPASRTRRLGRVIASVAGGGSFFLGFLWAVVDEEHLTWHDRMSETCLTLVAPRQAADRP